MSINDPGFSFGSLQPNHDEILNQKTMMDQWVEENIFGFAKKSLIHFVSSSVAWLVKSGFH